MVMLITRNLWRKLHGMSAFTTIIVRIKKQNKLKRLTVGKKSARNLIYLVSVNIFGIQNRCSLRFWSWRCRPFRTKRRNKISSSMSRHVVCFDFLASTTSLGTDNKQTNCYSKPPQQTSSLLAPFFCYFARVWFSDSSHAILSSVPLELLSLAATDKRGKVSENTAGSCQWLLTVTSPTAS